jgi:hypothetical protein
MQLHSSRSLLMQQPQPSLQLQGRQQQLEWLCQQLTAQSQLAPAARAAAPELLSTGRMLQHCTTASRLCWMLPQHMSCT